MRIVVTDEGLIWNAKNPILEKYADIVTVVCMRGQEVTDKYHCFVPPHRVMMGMDRYGVEDHLFEDLASVAYDLASELGYHEDIVFLSDCEPSSLYPFYALKDICKNNNLHLIAMPPLYFQRKNVIEAHRYMLSDLSKLKSLFYYDINRKLHALEENIKINDFVEMIIKDMEEIIPKALSGIFYMNNSPCFFNFSSMEYVPLEDGFDKIHLEARWKDAAEFPAVKKKHRLLGIVVDLVYPDDDESTKEAVERPVARIDGKRVCNILRNQRLQLAKANNIPFKSRECYSVGPCAGTCAKCDIEAQYLRKKLMRIPEEDRVYPQFDPYEEVGVWSEI